MTRISVAQADVTVFYLIIHFSVFNFSTIRLFNFSIMQLFIHPSKNSSSKYFNMQVFSVFRLILSIAVLPHEGPKISGGRPRYHINDVVNVNCTSGRSKPATHLTWFINGEPVEPTFLKNYDTLITGREGLETTVLGLEFKVRANHFRKGDMKLKVGNKNSL